MDQQPKHSLFIFRNHLTDDFIESLLDDYVYNGIKVYLFTMDSLKEYEDWDEWKEAKKRKLFGWWKVPYQTDYQGASVSFIDGKVTNQQIYDYVCHHTDFPSKLYEAEHSPANQHLIISAGAGTGKTTWMIERFLFLKHMGMEDLFFHSAFITFTHQAAIKIRQRIIQRFRDYYEVTYQPIYLKWIDEVKHLHISTLSAFVETLFEKAGIHQPIPVTEKLRSFRKRKKELMFEAIREYTQVSPEAFRPFTKTPRENLVELLLKMNELLECQYLGSLFHVKLHFGNDQVGFAPLAKFVLKYVHQHLETEKKELKQWEIQDVVRYLERMVVMKRLKKKWNLRYLLIDEFQDVSPVQVDFLFRLQLATQCTLTITGDAKQSMYRFHGTEYTSFSALKKRLIQQGESVTTIHFTKNYRNTPRLVQQLNTLVMKWGNQLASFPASIYDQLQSMRPIGNKNKGIVFGPFAMGYAESENQAFRQLLEQLRGTDTAILVRFDYQIQEVIKQCEQLGFFCERSRLGNFYRSLPVREMYILVRFLLFPENPSFAYALHRSSYGVNTLSNDQLIEQFEPDQKVILSLLEKQPDFIYWRQMQELAQRKPIFSILRMIIKDLSPHEVYSQRFLTRMKTIHPNRDIQDFVKEARARRMEYQMGVEKLFYLLRKHFSKSAATLYGMERVLRKYMETDDQEMLDPLSTEYTGHRFHVMTIQQAKENEFDHVILPYTYDPLVSDSRTVVFLHKENEEWRLNYRFLLSSLLVRNTYFMEREPQEMKEILGEEARLLYIALTRVRKQVFVHAIEENKRSNLPNTWMDLLKMGE
ncbi:UvrD-helicase domain-containing protein [Thermoflavimicrobium daqui]|uniref:UvrD-helicase domain-containing protein n=1 Tax=Thermoflavimicrobium daqui TaxID=2137476 RepID=UPI00143D02C3|nr:UvrD-helicase domain-containing protein [Thermoflavimicrobium daqui]